jgi:hypothetical protein
MSRGISLAPWGLVIERVESETDKPLLVARPISKTAACPTCSGISARIHSLPASFGGSAIAGAGECLETGGMRTEAI